MNRKWIDDETGWPVTEVSLGEIPTRVETCLTDPHTGRHYRRTHDSTQPGHLVPISEWVEMIHLGRELVGPRQPAHIRRAQRVLAMVHELHKVGFQRLRVDAHLAPSGLAWRCKILPKSGASRHHGAVDTASMPSVLHSSAFECEYFGWSDAKYDTARQLAQKFLERFPHIARSGRGRDPEYAGWYVEMLGHAERGALPVIYSNDEGPRLDYVVTTGDVRLPMPPPGEEEVANFTPLRLSTS